MRRWLRIRTTLARHLLKLPICEFDRRRIGDLLSRASSDVTVVRSVVTSGLVSSLSAGVLFVGVVVLMLRLDPLLFAITAAAITVGAIVEHARRQREDLIKQAHLRQGKRPPSTGR